MDQLTTDLKSGDVPNYSHIILNQCREMHGLPECNNMQKVISTGDTWIGKIVNQIKNSSLWTASGHSAIIITWDEDNNPPHKTGNQGCCGIDPNSHANFGGGHIATIVITNHLRTTEDAFGIYEYLNEAGDTAKGVKPMTSLFITKNTW